MISGLLKCTYLSIYNLFFADGKKNVSGEDATLAQQNEELQKCQFEIYKANIILKYQKRKLESKDLEMDKIVDKKLESRQEHRKKCEKLKNDVKTLEKQLGAFAGERFTKTFDQKMYWIKQKMKSVEQKKAEIEGELRDLQDGLSHIDSSTVFKYSDPTPNFDRRRVKGMFCNLFKVKDPAFFTAIEVAACGYVSI
jgi:structural maintenance of chromosome 2